MTDEEMAEKYAYNHVHYEVAKRENGSEYAKEVSSVTIKEACLAGIKIGRKDAKYDLMTKLKDEGIVKVLKDSVFSRLSSQEQQELCAWIEYSIEKELEKLNKANEWHDLRKDPDDLPKEMENILCYCKGAGIKFCCVGHTIVGGDKKTRWWANNKSEELIVIKWKEIILEEEE